MAEEQVSTSQYRETVTLSLFVGMGALSCLELIFIIPGYFKRWSGMYFWGVIFATTGATMMTVGNLLLYLFVTDHLKGLSISLIQLGYATYCPADFVVLYSRLHLVGTTPRLLTWVSRAIILELLFVELPAGILYTWTMLPAGDSLAKGVQIATLIQGPFYYGLQLTISFIYVHHIYATWKDATGLPRGVKNMFVGFALIACMDLLCLALQEAQQVQLQACVSVCHSQLQMGSTKPC